MEGYTVVSMNLEVEEVTELKKLSKNPFLDRSLALVSPVFEHFCVTWNDGLQFRRGALQSHSGCGHNAEAHATQLPSSHPLRLETTPSALSALRC